MVQCGLICSKAGKKVPLENIKVTVNIHDFIACVESTLEYVNQEDEAIEAVFMFPMDDDSAVFHFQVAIDGRVIIAECQEKEQAKQTYDDAMAQGHGAFMLQESEDSGDIFEMNVGNLPAKKKAVVSFSYVLKLKLDSDGLVSYKLPTILNPRYSPGGIGGLLHKVTPFYWYGPHIPYTLDFIAVIKGSKGVKHVKSDSVPITWKKNGNGAVEVKLTDTFRFDRDIELLVQYEGLHKATALIGKGDPEQSSLLKQNVVMLNIFPEINKGETTRKIEFVFVVDRSGSMDGNNIKHAKDTLLIFLKSLPVGCYFNIISFGSNYDVLYTKGSEPYNQETLQNAMKLQSSMKADMGGTELLRPLTHMYTKMKLKDGYSRQIFVLTDGDVTNSREVINLVQKNSANTRVFTFGIGHGASTSLVKGMAKAGKGKAEVVTGKDRLQTKVVSCLKLAMQPSVKDMKLHWQLPDGVKVVNVPEKCPVMFDGEHFVSFGIIQGEHPNEKIKVDLCATIGNEAISDSLKFLVQEGQHDPNYPIHRLAAKEQIKSLENSGEESASTKEKIILLSLSTNIVSKYTSFVGVDKETRVVTCNQRSVPGPRGAPSNIMYQQMCYYAPPPQQPQQQPACQSSYSDHEVVDIMNVNIDKVLERNQKLCDLDDRSSDVFGLSELVACESTQFYRKSTRASAFPSFGISNGLYSVGSGISNLIRTATAHFAADEKTSAAEISKSDVVLKIISFQNFDGSWDLSKDLTSLLGTDENGLATRTNLLNEKILATILTITFLEKKYSDRRDEWSIIVDKATVWLETQNLQGYSVQQVKQMAMSSL